MRELEQQAKGWAGKLDEQDLGQKKKGRKLSDSGAKARFDHAVCEAHLGKIIKVDMKAGLFSYAIDEAALKLAESMDGKLLVVTNVADMAPDKVIVGARFTSQVDEITDLRLKLSNSGSHSGGPRVPGRSAVPGCPHRCAAGSAGSAPPR